MAIFDVVFSSGGTKGVAFAGAVEVLTQRGHTIRRVAGTSAGAISATLIAAGYSARELLKILEGQQGRSPFADFLEPPDANAVLDAVRQPDSETRTLVRQAIIRAITKYLDGLTAKAPKIAAALKLAVGFGRGELYDQAFDAFFDVPADKRSTIAPILSFLEFGGFYSVEPITAWLTKLLQAKVANFQPTWSLAEFHQRTGRDVTVITADTSEKQALFLNHRTAPDCPLIEAVRMSMSIPLVWPEVAWQANWGKYLGQPKTGHFCVDGGAMLNLPIHLFALPNDVAVRKIMGEPPQPLGNPLGLWLDDTLPVPGDMEAPQIERSKLVDRLTRLVDTATRWEDEVIRRYEPFVCRVPSFGYSSVEFASSPARMQVLINSGRCAMTDHLLARKLVN